MTLSLAERIELTPDDIDYVNYLAEIARAEMIAEEEARTEACRDREYEAWVERQEEIEAYRDCWHGARRLED